MNLVVNHNKKDTLFKLGIMLAIFLVFAGYYTYTQVFGGATIGKTLTVNPDLESGLVGHWTFDGSDMDWSQTTAEVRDRSGNNNHGNTINLDSSAVVPGKLGQGADFNGNSNHVSIPDSASLDTITDAITISAWVHPDSGSLSSRRDIIQRAGGSVNGGDAGDVWWFNLQDGGKVSFYSENISGGVYQKSIATIPDDRWTHVIVTYNDVTDIRFYINGEIDSVTNASGSFDTGNQGVAIASRGFVAPDWYFAGKLDDVRIYNRALSAEEVSRIYELGATTHIATTITENPDLESDLVGHWTLDGTDMDWSSTTAEARDRSEENNHGNVINFDSTSVRTGKIGQALESDGLNDYVLLPDTLKITSYPVSVAFWVNPITGDATNDRLYLVTTTRGIYNGYSVGITSSNQVETGASGNTTSCSGGGRRGQSTNMSPAPIVRNQWQHVAVLFRGEDDRAVYVNGIEQTLGSLSGTGGGPTLAYTSGVSVVLGSTPNNGCSVAEYSQSILDDVRIYNRALSAEEVSRIYELGATTHIATTITENPDLESDLVGHWTLDGTDMDWSSTTAEARDRSEENNHGNVINFDSTSVRTGKIGQALAFNSNDSIDVTHNSTYSFTRTNPFSIFLWMNTSNTTDDYQPLVNKLVATSYQGYFIQRGADVNNEDKLYVGLWNSFGGNRRITVRGSTIVNDSKWHHVGFTYDGSGDATGVKMYVDGSIENSVIIHNTLGSNEITNSNPLTIGRELTDVYFDGTLDDVRIYNHALSKGEVKRLYEIGL